MDEQSPYDHLFDWLFPDHREAETKYKQIRQSLRLMIRQRLGSFCQHCHQTDEEIADIVIDRLAQKMPKLKENYVGEPVTYCYGVARFVILEHQKNRIVEEIGEDIPANAYVDPPSCMVECFMKLTPDEREVLEEYFEFDGQTGIEARRRLAERLGLTLEQIRQYIFKLRTGLRKCLAECRSRDEARIKFKKAQ
jgi:DNA-directed RNA polymerase specialized sigma24 family protein